MSRQQNTKINGANWSQDDIRSVWNKGRVTENYDKNVWRYDRCGSPMKYDDFGRRNSKYGWEIDHITPVCHSGSDELINLQPLQWENNVRKSDSLTFDYRQN